MARIVTVANQKGGVGKTTTAMNLGAALAEQGFRVLLVDGDPQANLSSYLGVTPGVAPHEDQGTLDEVYLAKRPLDAGARARFLARTAQENLHVIPSDRNLAGVEYYLFSRSDREQVLTRFLEGLRDEFDFVFIDTPPSLNLLTLNALWASDHLLVPVQPEFFSLEGIVKVREAVADVRARGNSRLSILGVLPTQVSHRRRLTAEVLGALRAELGDLLFEAMVHDNSALTESSGHGRSILAYDRSSRGAKDYLAVAAEFLARCQPAEKASLRTERPAKKAERRERSGDDSA